jgi:hypothetical protein
VAGVVASLGDAGIFFPDDRSLCFRNRAGAPVVVDEL